MRVIPRLYAIFTISVSIVLSNSFPTLQNIDYVVKELSKIAFNNKKILKKLESLVHPKLASKREKILRSGSINYKKTIVFEIPLLYEKCLINEFDLIIATRCCKQLQKKRALKRTDMNEKKYHSIIKNQINNNIKYKKSNHIIDTGIGKNHSLIQVKKLIKSNSIKETCIILNLEPNRVKKVSPQILKRYLKKYRL